MRVESCLLVGLVALLGACAAPPLPTPTTTASSFSPQTDWSRYGLARNDILSVVVFGHPEHCTPPDGTRVDMDGNVSLPEIGPVPVAGRSVEEARQLIRQALSSELLEPAVSVSVMHYGSRQVFVFGQLERPGAYVLDRPLNALQALSLAGGFRPGADRETCVVLRGPGEALEVHTFNADTPGADGLIALQPDDFVFVRRSGAGTFAEQAMPALTAVTTSVSALAQFVIALEILDDGGDDD